MNEAKVVVDTSVFVSLLFLKDIALTLHLDARLWTADDELKLGLRAKGFDRFFES